MTAPAKYYGLLAKPVRLADPHVGEHKELPLHLMTTAKRAALQRQLDAEMTARVEALFRFYGLERGEWQELTLALARQHVPGFAVIQNRGAPTVATVWLLSRLYRYINRRRVQGRRNGALPSVSAVCGHIAGKEPFTALFPELAGAKKARLRNLHSEAKGMRERYVEWRVGALRLAAADFPAGYVGGGSPPPWEHEEGSALYKKLTTEDAETETFTERVAGRSA